MKSVNTHYPFIHACAAIISLTSIAMAEEHPDDIAAKNTDSADLRDSDDGATADAA